MGSFALRMEAHNRGVEPPTLVRFSTSVTIKVVAHRVLLDRILNTSNGEVLSLVLDESDGSKRVAILNLERQVIGWLPDDEPLIVKLVAGVRYRATMDRIMRQGSRVERMYISLAIFSDAETMTLS